MQFIYIYIYIYIYIILYYSYRNPFVSVGYSPYRQFLATSACIFKIVYNYTILHAVNSTKVLVCISFIVPTYIVKVSILFCAM